MFAKRLVLEKQLPAQIPMSQCMENTTFIIVRLSKSLLKYNSMNIPEPAGRVVVRIGKDEFATLRVSKSSKQNPVHSCFWGGCHL